MFRLDYLILNDVIGARLHKWLEKSLTPMPAITFTLQIIIFGWYKVLFFWTYFFFIDGEFYQQLSMLITHQLKIKLVGIGCVIVFCIIIIYKKVRQPFSVVLKVRVWCENRSNMLNFTYLTSYYYNSVLFAFLRDFVLFWVKICTLYKLKKRLTFDETISIWINNQ